MPFTPELFSAQVLARFQAHRNLRRTGVPSFDDFLAGELDALVRSFVTETTGSRTERDVAVEDVGGVATPARVVEEFMVHVVEDAGPIELPMAIAADLDRHARITKLRSYFDRWPMSGVPGVRAPLLQPDRGLRAPDVVGAYNRALAAADVDGVVASFEPDGTVRGSYGGAVARRDAGELRAFYEQLLASGGTVLELCAMTDDGRACALEYIAVAPDGTTAPAAGGIAVHVRGDSGKLAAVRIYEVVAPAPGRLVAGEPNSATDTQWRIP